MDRFYRLYVWSDFLVVYFSVNPVLTEVLYVYISMCDHTWTDQVSYFPIPKYLMESRSVCQ